MDCTIIKSIDLTRQVFTCILMILIFISSFSYIQQTGTQMMNRTFKLNVKQVDHPTSSYFHPFIKL